VLLFMGEADGKFSGEFATWDQAGEFYATLGRWVAGKRQPLPDDHVAHAGNTRRRLPRATASRSRTQGPDPFSHVLPRPCGCFTDCPVPRPHQTKSCARMEKTPTALKAAIPIAGRETIFEHRGDNRSATGHAAAGMSALFTRVCTRPAGTRRWNAGADCHHPTGRKKNALKFPKNLGRTPSQIGVTSKLGPMAAGLGGNSFPARSPRTPHRLDLRVCSASKLPSRKLARTRLTPMQPTSTRKTNFPWLVRKTHATEACIHHDKG